MNGWVLRAAGATMVWVFGAAAVTQGQEAQGVVIRIEQAGDAPLLSNAILAKTFTVRVEGVTLADALAAVSEASTVRLVFSGTHLPLQKIVSLVASKISLADALSVLLEGTGFEPVVAPSGSVALVLKTHVDGLSSERQQGTAVVTGFVRDSATGAGIAQVTVRLEGTAYETKSVSDGKYTITGIPAGEYRVSARRVGYLSRTRTITLTDGQSTTLHFLLNPPATKLDEIVTTALGEQRRYQVGNVISTINVDSLAPTAPVTDVTDLLSGRVPGLEVVESSGLVGGGEAIRIRGTSSLIQQSDPIIIVDGIRVDNTPGGNYSSLFSYNTASPTRLNDLDYSQIESISVLKGPSAATEYGTDAANGVIIITTKRGTAGKAQWSASASQSASTIPIGFANYYYTAGHSPDGRATATACPITFGFTFYPSAEDGSCIADSITAFNPLNHAATTSYGTGPGSSYDLGVRGGSESFQYYLDGGFNNQTGTTQLPEVFRSEATALGYPNSWLNPNSQQQRSLRSNMDVHLNHATEVQVSVAYMSTFQSAPALGYQGLTQLTGLGNGEPIVDDSAGNYGYGGAQYGYNFDSPLGELGRVSSQGTQRYLTSATTNWRPSTWLVGHAVFGLDHGSQQVQNLESPQTAIVSESDTAGGSLQVTRMTTDVYTVQLDATATVTLARRWESATTLGAALVDTRQNGVTATASGLTSTSVTLASEAYGANNYSSQILSRVATLGAYLNEQLGFADRLYLTGALRVDEGSGFGGSYDAVLYPKFSASWLIYNSGGTTVRLRGSYGPAGQQPPYGAALQQYTATTATGNNGNQTAGLQFSSPGNNLLKPEESTEYEGGVDVDLWGNRLSAEISGYSKTTTNALYPVTLGWDLDNWSYTENIGEVRNTGWEAVLTAVPVQTKALDWTLSLSGSYNGNKLVSLAPGITSGGGGGDEYFKPGYALNSYWGNAVRYTDRNHDGIIEPTEVAVTSNNYTTGYDSIYAGASLAPAMANLSMYVGFFRDVIRIGTLFSYEGGFKVAGGPQDVFGRSGIEQNIPTTPLWEQAQDIAEYNGAEGPVDQYLPGDFVRFQELSLTYSIPRSLARSVHLNTLSLTAAVRNLALWTRYPYGDPTVSDISVGYTNQTTGAPYVNNDARGQDVGVVPLTRTWVVRLNVGL